MISVQEAKQLIHQNAITGPVIETDIYDACGYACASDIISSIDFPSFRQSAMDGYALRFEDVQNGQSLFVEHEVQAGAQLEIATLKPQEAIRIFTGASVPADADTVVMQEHIHRDGNAIQIKNELLKQGDNIRPIGSQTKKGDCILKRGSVITPGAVGLLASIGIKSLQVYQKPVCSILTTGKELIAPGNELQPGQIFESNSYALKIALDEMHIKVHQIIQVDDDKLATQEAIQKALLQCDILLLTGGVSVGDYDFVIDALEKNNVQQVFHKVKQKPGKPIYFGVKNQQLIFGLPGNPGSVLTCFYEYVVPIIRMYCGYKNPNLLSLQMPLGQAFQKKQGLTHFLKGVLNGSQVEILDHQESYKMNAFAEANCLVQIEENDTHLNAGDLVTIHLIKL